MSYNTWNIKIRVIISNIKWKKIRVHNMQFLKMI